MTERERWAMSVWQRVLLKLLVLKADAIPPEGLSNEGLSELRDLGTLAPEEYRAELEDLRVHGYLKHTKAGGFEPTDKGREWVRANE